MLNGPHDTLCFPCKITWVKCSCSQKIRSLRFGEGLFKSMCIILRSGARPESRAELVITLFLRGLDKLFLGFAKLLVGLAKSFIGFARFC